MINDERRDAALTYLVETDELAAELKAAVERQEYKLKTIKQTIFLATAGSVTDRVATAETNDKYQAGWIAHVESIKSYNAVHNKRQTEGLVIEVWRSIQANRRHG